MEIYNSRNLLGFIYDFVFNDEYESTIVEIYLVSFTFSISLSV